MPSSKILICFLFLAMSLINIGYVASQESVTLSIDIEPVYSIVSAGDKVLIQINLMQLGDQRRKDIIVLLSLIDTKGEKIYESTESIALETQASLVVGLDIPKNANQGKCIVNVEIFDINEENLLAKISKEIIIEKTKITRSDIYLIGSYLILIGLSIIIIILYIKNRNLNRNIKQKITKQDIKKYLKDK